MPSVPEICSIIAERVNVIEEGAVSNNTTLIKAAKLLELNDCHQVEVRTNKLFLVCKDCLAPRICQTRSKNSELCPKCQEKNNVNKWTQNKKEDEKISSQQLTSTMEAPY